MEKLTKTQIDISTLVKGLFTLRRDTNVLLDAQFALCGRTQEEVKTDDNLAGKDED